MHGFMGHCSFQVVVFIACRAETRRVAGTTSTVGGRSDEDNRECRRFMTGYGDLMCITFMHFTHHQPLRERETHCLVVK